MMSDMNRQTLISSLLAATDCDEPHSRAAPVPQLPPRLSPLDDSRLTKESTADAVKWRDLNIESLPVLSTQPLTEIELDRYLMETDKLIVSSQVPVTPSRPNTSMDLTPAVVQGFFDKFPEDSNCL